MPNASRAKPLPSLMSGLQKQETEFIEQVIFRLRESEARIEKCLAELSEDDVWRRPNDASNSVGNLMLHLCGNITQYILSSLDEKEDRRDRDAEFEATEGFTRSELLERFTKVIGESIRVLENICGENLMRERSVQGFRLTGIGIAIHVIEHLSYHTGQIAFWTKLLKEKDLGFYAGVDLNERNEDG